MHSADGVDFVSLKWSTDRFTIQPQ